MVLGLNRLYRMISTARQQRRMVKFYGRYIRAGDICFDVGANVGNRTEIFRRLGAIVVAVEPQVECMRQLAGKFGADKRVVLVPKALGGHEGVSRMMICNANTISSLSPEWIESVKSSGRFSEYRWDNVAEVSMTTLDVLIRQYGIPSFCKIDVEGYEHEVLKGLSQAVGMVSFEFTPEFIASATNCIARLSIIGMDRFNYSIGESMEMTLASWVPGKRMSEILVSLPDKTIFGDVYATVGNEL